MPRTNKTILLDEDPLWYKDAIIYEVHIRAFYDSNGDGIGDFPGLTQKLDYLEDLGVTGIWLLPFYPSPFRDDGYDISDYYNIHPDYGTLKDFREFLKEAHKRSIRVITELVLNHTSDQHPWFQKSRKAKPGSPQRDFYVWSDDPHRFKDARVIFQDFETSNWAWDHEAGAYYWHRFYSHQPDLNFDNPEVRNMIFRVIDFWLGLGVDGLRLDAVPYLFEREGTNCENLPETYDFLRELRAHVDGKFQNRVLLAEANQWPEDAAAYFGKGDVCHMAFHFPLMPRMFLGLQTEDRYPIVDILAQTPDIPDSCQWALFLRNHDELTLEMVTDEERDYMYRVYAQDPHARINLGIRRRLAPLMQNSRRRMELMKMLLFFLPGTPVLYYGDEIGMGDDYYLGDRNGVRTPMQWSPDRNAGFSMANPQKLYMPVIIDPEYHYISVNVENQQRNPASFLWWMKHVIATRKRFKAPGRGGLEFLYPANPKILAFIRMYQEEVILFVANLSRYFQVAELDLARYAGSFPEEVYSHQKFPMIRELPYTLTLGSYGFFLLSLKTPGEAARATAEKAAALPEMHALTSWETVLSGKNREILEGEVLPKFLQGSRWFGGKGARMREVQITDTIPLFKNAVISYLLFVQVTYFEGNQDSYLLPVSFAFAKKVEGPMNEGEMEDLRSTKSILEESCESVLARVFVNGDEGILYDSMCSAKFREVLLTLIGARKKLRGRGGELVARPGRLFRRLLGSGALPIRSQRVKAEQSNTSVLYEDRFYFKLFRNLKPGFNPDQEISQFLTEKAAFPYTPRFAGTMEYLRPGSEPIAIGLLQGYIPNQGDAWTYTQDALGRYFEKVLTRAKEIAEIPPLPSSFLDTGMQNSVPLFREVIEGYFLEQMALLGKRTAEMHLALASAPDEREFTPEPFSLLYQKAVFQSMRSLLSRVMRQLKNNLGSLPDALRKEGPEILQAEQKILSIFQKITARKISALRIRVHGDYHLGQVLYTGKEFFIIDFEGEPARALSERRLKQGALKDVAGMVRSFHYAAYTALGREASVRPGDTTLLEPWIGLWYRYVSGIFVRAYLDAVGKGPLIPENRDEVETMLRAYLMEKAVYEVGYELNNRPDWVGTPLRGIKDLLEGS